VLSEALKVCVAGFDTRVRGCACACGRVAVCVPVWGGGGRRMAPGAARGVAHRERVGPCKSPAALPCPDSSTHMSLTPPLSPPRIPAALRTAGQERPRAAARDRHPGRAALLHCHAAAARGGRRAAARPRGRVGHHAQHLHTGGKAAGKLLGSWIAGWVVRLLGWWGKVMREACVQVGCGAAGMARGAQHSATEREVVGSTPARHTFSGTGHAAAARQGGRRGGALRREDGGEHRVAGRRVGAAFRHAGEGRGSGWWARGTTACLYATRAQPRPQRSMGGGEDEGLPSAPLRCGTPWRAHTDTHTPCQIHPATQETVSALVALLTTSPGSGGGTPGGSGGTLSRSGSGSGASASGAGGAAANEQLRATAATTLARLLR
jgi:hypothetical protein